MAETGNFVVVWTAFILESVCCLNNNVAIDSGDYLCMNSTLLGDVDMVF